MNMCRGLAAVGGPFLRLPFVLEKEIRFPPIILLELPYDVCKHFVREVLSANE